MSLSDATGNFELPRPKQRAGLWNTEVYPPTVKADGYVLFPISGWPGNVRYERGKVIIPLTRRTAGADQ
jgi:hypothetical protein